jgi:hypothetical protein
MSAGEFFKKLASVFAVKNWRIRVWGERACLCLLALSTLSSQSSEAAVLINEICAAPSEQQLSWTSNGVPRLGSGLAWYEPDFNAGGWTSGGLPAGYGFPGIVTDLTGDMKDKTYSLYIRKEFSLTSTQAAFTDPLILAIDYNDGFVAYLNGREVARVNCGPTNHFIYATQPAYNVATNNGFVEYNLGPANALLLPGRNVLAIQAHNAEQPSTPSNPGLIIEHLPTPEFKINAGLRASTSTIISLRPAALDFNNAAGGARTHANTNGVISDTVSGTFAPNGSGWPMPRIQIVLHFGRDCRWRRRKFRLLA